MNGTWGNTSPEGIALRGQGKYSRSMGRVLPDALAARSHSTAIRRFNPARGYYGEAH